MMKEITIGSSIDDSTKLQKIIDSNGNNPAKFVFSDASHILVNSRIRFWNYFELDGKDSTFELKEHVPTSIFGEQIPLIGSKLSKGAAGWDLHNIIFEGNRDSQKYVPRTSPEHPNTSGNWGRGYHNTIGPLCSGDIKSPTPSNATDILIHDCEANNNLGDFARIEGGTNIKIWNVKGKRGGHDVVCAAAAKNVEIWGLDIDTCVNAAVRFRSVENGKIHDCNLRGTRDNTGPLVQVQNTAVNWNCTKIELYNNIFTDSLGPAAWVIGTTGKNDIIIRNNLFLGCGKEPASVKTADVGGICIDGFNGLIEYNTFDQNMGYGIVFSGWKSTSSLSGLESTVSRNIITKTTESLYKGTKSGSGIVNLTGKRHTVDCLENCQYGNKTANHWGVNCKSVYNVDPSFVAGDYHLKDDSPCVFSEYELGVYNGVSYHIPDFSKWPAVVISFQTKEELTAYVSLQYDIGSLGDDDHVSYFNVGKDFAVDLKKITAPPVPRLRGSITH